METIVIVVIVFIVIIYLTIMYNKIIEADEIFRKHKFDDKYSVDEFEKEIEAPPEKLAPLKDIESDIEEYIREATSPTDELIFKLKLSGNIADLAISKGLVHKKDKVKIEQDIQHLIFTDPEFYKRMKLQWKAENAQTKDHYNEAVEDLASLMGSASK